jgi:rhodanese-related sulfurtransferase
MPTTVKDLMSAARAAVPSIAPAEAMDLVKNKDAVLVDVRDGTE